MCVGGLATWGGSGLEKVVIAVTFSSIRKNSPGLITRRGVRPAVKVGLRQAGISCVLLFPKKILISNQERSLVIKTSNKMLKIILSCVGVTE